MKRIWAAASISLVVASVLYIEGPAAASPIGRALGDLAERVELSPRDAGLLNDYGNLLVHAGLLEDAESAYRSALEITPDSLPAHYNLGLLELERGHTRAARKQFRRAIKLDPSFGRAHYGLGSAYVAVERNRRAVKHYSRAFLLDPELREVAVYPEILFNKLTTWASMHSYLGGSPGRFARLYDDPRPIVGLLIPGIDELLDRSTDPQESEELEEPAGEGQPAEPAEPAEQAEVG